MASQVGLVRSLTRDYNTFCQETRKVPEQLTQVQLITAQCTWTEDHECWPPSAVLRALLCLTATKILTASGSSRCTMCAFVCALQQLDASIDAVRGNLQAADSR